MSTKYQVVLLQLSTGTYLPADGSGMVARRWDTLEQAQADIASWTSMFTRRDSNLRLAVQRIDYTLVPGTQVSTGGEPVAQSPETQHPVTSLVEQKLPTGGLSLLFVCDGISLGNPDHSEDIVITDLTAVTQGGPPCCTESDCSDQDQDLRFIGYRPDGDAMLSIR